MHVDVHWSKNREIPKNVLPVTAALIMYIGMPGRGTESEARCIRV
jgi:hypothetical protein